MIEDVKELRQEFDSRTLLNLEHASDTEIVAVEPKTLEHISAQAGCSIIGKIAIAVGVVGGLTIRLAVQSLAWRLLRISTH